MENNINNFTELELFASGTPEIEQEAQQDIATAADSSLSELLDDETKTNLYKVQHEGDTGTDASDRADSESSSE